MKISVTFQDLSTAEASRLIGLAGNAPGAAAPNAPASAPPPPPTTPATPPPPMAPAATPAAPPPPAATPAPPPPAAAPPPPPPAAAGGVTQESVLAAMQAYSAQHKTAGVKAVLAKCNITKITEANADQLAWLLSAFQSLQPPTAFG